MCLSGGGFLIYVIIITSSGRSKVVFKLEGHSSVSVSYDSPQESTRQDVNSTNVLFYFTIILRTVTLTFYWTWRFILFLKGLSTLNEKNPRSFEPYTHDPFLKKCYEIKLKNIFVVTTSLSNNSVPRLYFTEVDPLYNWESLVETLNHVQWGSKRSKHSSILWSWVWSVKRHW